jgi:hypothetical protein
LFGAVAKELHAHAADEAVRREHHHAPCYCSKRHAWKALAEHSHSVYNVKLHAACHEGYASMYTYITCPSAKKPLSELDPEVFLSQEHPRGQVLRRLLEAGATRAQAVSGRRRKASRAEARLKLVLFSLLFLLLLLLVVFLCRLSSTCM